MSSLNASHKWRRVTGISETSLHLTQLILIKANFRPSFERKSFIYWLHTCSISTSKFYLKLAMGEASTLSHVYHRDILSFYTASSRSRFLQKLHHRHRYFIGSLTRLCWLSCLVDLFTCFSLIPKLKYS